MFVETITVANLDAVGTEIDKHTIIDTCCGKIIYQLHLMDRQKCIHGFQFNDDLTLSNHICPIVSNNVILVIHFKRNFCLNRYTTIT